MQLKNAEGDRSILTKTVIQFFVGATVGLILPLILLSYTWQSGLGFTAVHIIVSIGFVGLCGTLSAILGHKFLDKLGELMNLLPQI
ncbi:hypothetical protein [Merismopedia glauca]|uniref:Uncharacterized protein n=1 Tax=Merismopedia glauca CCAP 1448/3 TaxID=1296344 RepID=A0A2T1C6J6_9CYAN|nr:hypothetical protein [Merismopedia glauca]PSB03854.1 hypothetical protein C7B64_06470 [Merismopedia glauca CCAP 1448/3]